MHWLLSTVGKRGYIAEYLRAVEPGVHVTGTGRTAFTAGFASCDASRLVPDIGSDNYLSAVQELVRMADVDAMLSFADPDVHRLSSCLLYTSPSPRDRQKSRMPSSA